MPLRACFEFAIYGSVLKAVELFGCWAWLGSLGVSLYTPLLSGHGATSVLRSQWCLPAVVCKLYPLKLRAKINLCSLDCLCRVLWSRRQEQSMQYRTSRTAACSVLV